MNYSEFVRSKFKPGADIAAEMTPHKATLLYSSTGYLIAECDAIDRAKKFAIYNLEGPSIDYIVAEDHFKDFTITTQQAELLHAAIGIAGEAGELLDTVRKHVFDGQELDRDNVKEEAGDIIFYLEALIQTMQTTVHEIITGNMTKLSKRYEAGYSDKAAQERADKAGEE